MILSCPTHHAFTFEQRKIIMQTHFSHSVKTIRFDEDYQPSNQTRLTTNFANLARGEHRQENLRKALQMINNNFNSRVDWDNPNSDRYSV